MSDASSHIYDFGAFRFDMLKRELRKDGQVLPLGPKVIDTLRVLVLNHGRVVTKDDLMTEIWGEAFVEESGLMRNISLLRKALGEQEGAIPYIVTVPRQGYRFLPEVHSVDAGESIGIREITRTRIVVEEHAERSDHRSLAVLPFRSVGDDDHIGIGIADALITKLSNIRSLRVRPTSAVMEFGNGAYDVSEAARDLDVDIFIEGSVRRSGERLRVTVQVVNRSNGVAIWAEKFDETLSNIFKIEDSITERVAAALEPDMTVDERGQMTKRGTGSLPAYRLYATALFHMHKFTIPDNEAAIEMLETAIVLDPDYGTAHSCLLGCLIQKASFGIVDIGSIEGRVKVLANKVMNLDPLQPAAHYGNGSVSMFFDRDMAAAERSYARAVELSPNDANAIKHFAVFLFIAGRFDEAIDRAKLTRELDPATPSSSAHVGFTYYYARRFEESIGWHRITLEMNPGFVNSQIGLAWSLVKLGAMPEAIECIATIDPARSGEPNVIAARGYVAAASGHQRPAREALEQLIELSRSSYVSPLDIATIYAELGDVDSAFEWLERAKRERSFWLVFLKVNPRFDKLRPDPRFERFLADLTGPTQ